MTDENRCNVCGAKTGDHCQRSSRFPCVETATPPPVTPPAVVAALVEALEGMQAAAKDIPPSIATRLSDDLVTRFLRADGKATAALTLYREAGR